MTRRVLAALLALSVLALGCQGNGREPEPDPEPQPVAKCEVPKPPVIPDQNTITVIACTTPLGHRAHMAVDGYLGDGTRFPSDEGGPRLPADFVDATPFAKVLHYPKGQIATVTFSVYTLQDKTTEVYCKILDNGKTVKAADSPRVKVSGPNSRAVCTLTTSGR